MKISLSRLPWYCKNDILVTGFIRIENQYFDNEALTDYFAGAYSLSEFEKILFKSNGQFSVIIKKDDEIWAASDRIRNFPLFYTKINGQYIIGDDCYELVKLHPDKEFDQDAYYSFLASGYVINNLTLIKNIYQVEAGSFVVLGETFKCNFYYKSSSEPVSDIDLNTGTEDLVNRLQNTFKSHLTVLKDKFIAIPLSGGFDSRLVAAMNARYHPDSILCYTYGTEDNPEVGPAREIAGRLGLKWINIVYNSGLIKDFLHDEIFCRYYPYVSNLTGMFFLQDYFAVKYLKEKELVPDNTIFMSGYSGDFIAGSYITPAMKFNMDKDKICSLIYREYFRLVKLDKTKEATLLKMIADRIPSGNSEAWKVIEAWDMKERHAKFIVNSARVYNFFGFSYVFPLWDNLLLDYMLNIPYSLRFNRRLYELTLKNHIFKEQNLNLKHEINPLPSQKRYQRFKETIKPLLPGRIMNRFLDLGSPIMYDEITRSMREEIGSEMIIPPRQPNYYNSYIVQWYLHKIHEHLLQGGK